MCNPAPTFQMFPGSLEGISLPTIKPECDARHSIVCAYGSKFDLDTILEEKPDYANRRRRDRVILGGTSRGTLVRLCSGSSDITSQERGYDIAASTAMYA
jgi:hypothetical protein